jgi:hypothetical protein
MEAVDYHFVYAAARVFLADLIDALRMTGFRFGARGHARHLLKSREENSMEANKKQTLFSVGLCRLAVVWSATTGHTPTLP